MPHQRFVEKARQVGVRFSFAPMAELKKIVGALAKQCQLTANNKLWLHRKIKPKES